MDNTSDYEPFGTTLAEVIRLYGSESVVRDCMEAKWLNPLIRRGRLCLFERKEVLETWERIAGGEIPPQRKKPTLSN